MIKVLIGLSSEAEIEGGEKQTKKIKSKRAKDKEREKQEDIIAAQEQALLDAEGEWVGCFNNFI